MMTKVINRHRQGRDSRDPEQSLEIGRKQLKAAPRRTRNLVTARPKRQLQSRHLFRAKTPVTT
jgi:hypothetical protein